MKRFSKNKVLLAFGLLTILVFSHPFFQAHAYWSLDKNGSMINTKYSLVQVLGEEDKKEEEKKSEEKKTDEQKKEQKQEEKKEDNNTKSQSESSNQTSASAQKTEQHTNEDKTRSTEEHEIKSEDVEKVEIHKIENENESEVHASGEGKMEINIKKNNKEEVKGRQESFEMETENGDKVHIELSSEKTQMEIKKNGISATVDLPISINPTLNKLILTTPDGEIPMESLPDEIIDNLKKNKQIDENSDVHINVKYEGGEIVYKIEEKKHKKIMGIIPIDLVKNMSVQDGTGVVLSTQESFITQLLRALSF